MKTNLTLLLLALYTGCFAQLYKGDGEVIFISETPMQIIEAKTTKAAATLNVTEKTVEFTIPIKTFEFKSPQMQLYFNEKFMESDKYPDARFKGVYAEQIGKAPGSYPVKVNGILVIHGVEMQREVEGIIAVLANGTMKLSATFKVKTADHKITIPKMMAQNIAEEIVVNVNADVIKSSGEVAPKVLAVACKDIDNKTYEVVKIGEQYWTAQNLKTIRFANGEKIPEAKTDEEWKAAGEKGSPAWCTAKHNPGEILYNYYAVIDKRGLAPAGWKVPSSLDWVILTRMLGQKEAGHKMKSKTGWESGGKATGNGSNESGFNSMPVMTRAHDGKFNTFTTTSLFWSTTKEYVGIGDYSNEVDISTFAYSNALGSGYSVRLVKN